MGSKSRTAISRPLLAPWASSAACFMVPKGPPVLLFTSKVPAECHLNHDKNETPYHKLLLKIYHKKITHSTKRSNENLRQTEHDRGTVLISDQTPELPLGFLDGLLVIGTHSWVRLCHGYDSIKTQSDNKSD